MTMEPCGYDILREVTGSDPPNKFGVNCLRGRLASSSPLRTSAAVSVAPAKCIRSSASQIPLTVSVPNPDKNDILVSSQIKRAATVPKSKQNGNSLVYIDYTQPTPVKKEKFRSPPPVKNVLPLPARPHRKPHARLQPENFAQRQPPTPSSPVVPQPNTLSAVQEALARHEASLGNNLSRDNQTYVMHHDLLDKLHEDHRNHIIATRSGSTTSSSSALLNNNGRLSVALPGCRGSVASTGSHSVFSQSSSNDSSLSSAESFSQNRPPSVIGPPMALSSRVCQSPVSNGIIGNGTVGLTAIRRPYTEQDLTAATEQLRAKLEISRVGPSNAATPPPPPYNGPHYKTRSPASVSSRSDTSSQVGALSVHSRRSNDSYTSSQRASSEAPKLGNCHHCKEEVQSAKDACVAMCQLYHNRCFSCHSCGRALKERPFYSVSGKNFCVEDFMYSEFQHTMQRCTECGHLITEMILQAMGKPYHPGCFRCCVCNDSLDGISFTVGVDNKVYCVQDFHKLFAPKCAACSQPITPQPGEKEAVRLVAMDKDFHVGCYKCQDCKRSLSHQKEKTCFPIGDTLLCLECHVHRMSRLQQQTQMQLQRAPSRPVSRASSRTSSRPPSRPPSRPSSQTSSRCHTTDL